MRVRRLPLALVAWLVATCPGVVLAECTSPASPCETLRRVSLAFYGEVMEVEQVEGRLDQTVEFRVIEAFKGVQADHFRGKFVGSAEGTFFVKGMRTVVYAVAYAGSWSTACLAQGPNEREALRVCTRRIVAEMTTAMVVEDLRDLPPILPGGAPSDGRVSPIEQRRHELYGELRRRGPDAVMALAQQLRAPDLQLRMNVALAMLVFAMDLQSGPGPRLDLRPAVPGLIDALEDYATPVRWWSAQTLGAIGPDAAPAVPALLKLLAADDVGSRSSACLALGGIGPAAHAALPALQSALSDPNADVRQFARKAIEKIGVPR